MASPMVVSDDGGAGERADQPTPPRRNEARNEENDTDSAELAKKETKSADASTKVHIQDFASDESLPPPLPLRPGGLQNLGSSLKVPKASRPRLQSSATTALSLADIQTQLYQDGSRETFVAQAEQASSDRSLRDLGSLGRLKGQSVSEVDSTSIRSYVPTPERRGDAESILGDILDEPTESTAWRLLGTPAMDSNIFEFTDFEDDESISEFEHEFDELEELDVDAANEGQSSQFWDKHFTEVWLREASEPMAIKEQTFPHSFFGWKANL